MQPLVPDLSAVGGLPYRHEHRLRLLVYLADEMAAGADSLKAASDRLQERDLRGELHPDVRCSHSTVCALPRRLAPLTERVFGGDVDLYRKGREGMPCQGLTPAGQELVRLARAFLARVDGTGAHGA